MNADEKLAALGLADVEVVEREEFNRLPERRRLLLGPMPDGQFRRLRLPDPPPVAALRRILAIAVESSNGDDFIRIQVERNARAALAEFDGTTT